MSTHSKTNRAVAPLVRNTVKPEEKARVPEDRRSSRGGLSLLEVLAVAVITAILAAVVLPRLAAPSLDAKKNACYVTKGKIEVQTQLWYRNKGTWPATNLSDVAADTAYFPEGLPTCPVDSTAYTIDATSHKVVGHTH